MDSILEEVKLSLKSDEKRKKLVFVRNTLIEKRETASGWNGSDHRSRRLGIYESRSVKGSGCGTSVGIKGQLAPTLINVRPFVACKWETLCEW